MSRSVITASLASALRLAIGATLVFNVSIRAEAATYYVSLSGSDANPGTIASPKRQISAGVALLNPGDTLYLRGGTYTISSNYGDNIPSGTSTSNRTTIAEYPGETVIIQASRPATGFLISTALSYIDVRGITVDNVNSTASEAVYLGKGASYIQFIGVEVKNADNFGVVFAYPAHHNTFKDGSVHDSGDPMGTNIQRGHAFHSFGADDLIENNDVYDNEGYGIDYYNDPGPPYLVSRNIIRNNRVYRNGLGHSTAYGISIADGDGNQLYNNLVYGNQSGILVYHGTTTTGVWNNTIVGNVGNGLTFQYYRDSPVARNNIVYGNGSGIVDYGGESVGRSVQDHNLTSNPLFVNRAANDFRLTASSPARDTGAVVTAVERDFAGVSRPQNGAYDVGAFEYATAGPRAVTGVKVFRTY